MVSDQRLINHLNELGLVADAVLARLPEHLTLSSENGFLCIYENKNPQSKVYTDFIQGALSYRSRQHLNAENLIKACQLKGQKITTVLDGTCGLGVDSFLLSQAGFVVSSIEKNAVIHALLADGLLRYTQQHGSCFELYFGDFVDLLETLTSDVIYLDPMFPTKEKKSRNKKGMHLFQSIHQNESDDATHLLQLALTAHVKRVVIKRPSKSPVLTDYKPTFQVIGKTCRFDAYHLA